MHKSYSQVQSDCFAVEELENGVNNYYYSLFITIFAINIIQPRLAGCVSIIQLYITSCRRFHTSRHSCILSAEKLHDLNLFRFSCFPSYFLHNEIKIDIYLELTGRKRREERSVAREIEVSERLLDSSVPNSSIAVSLMSTKSFSKRICVNYCPHMYVLLGIMFLKTAKQRILPSNGT